jgi:hypothetical protein
MSLNLIATLAILIVFILIGLTLFSLRKPVLRKLLDPLIVFLDALYEPKYKVEGLKHFQNIVAERNRQYHQRFLKLVGVKG